jgi:hypothetical protein
MALPPPPKKKREYGKSPKFGHFLNFKHFIRPEINFFQTCFTVLKSCMALSTSGLNHQTW